MARRVPKKKSLRRSIRFTTVPAHPASTAIAVPAVPGSARPAPGVARALQTPRRQARPQPEHLMKFPRTSLAPLDVCFSAPKWSSTGVKRTAWSYCSQHSMQGNSETPLKTPKIELFLVKINQTVAVKIRISDKNSVPVLDTAHTGLQLGEILRIFGTKPRA